MKSSLIKAFVLTFSFAAVGLLALSPATRAQDSSGGMGACCGTSSSGDGTGDQIKAPPKLTCGPGTIESGGQCVIATPVK